MAMLITGHKNDMTKDIWVFCERPLAGIIAAGVCKMFEIWIGVFPNSPPR